MMKKHLCILFVLKCITFLNLQPVNGANKRPHIIFILADDLGFNDPGFRGSAQIPTPNIDALAFSGVILNRYYVTPICTPSRAALMTGKYPIHTGMQHTVLFGAEPRGLPLSEKLMPQYFNSLGYSSHIAGKWHLGHFKKVYTPLYRGFKSHVGFWTGHQDYFDHTAVEWPSWGLDMRNGMDVAFDLHGKYTTDVITDESVRVITQHNSSEPLFLYVAHAAVHSGNPYNPLPAPAESVGNLPHILDYNRRRYAAMLTELDDSVGRIVQTLEKQNMLQDSIIVFSTDNGGPAEGFNLNFASNWPLRGVKNTLFEGGVRGAGLLFYPKMKNRNRVAQQTMHIVDWLPTLLTAIGGDEALGLSNSSLDGMSIWKALNEDEDSPRRSMVHNIDDIYKSAAITVRDWKLIKGTNYNGAWDGWYGPAGLRDPKSYNVDNLYKSLVGKALTKLQLMATEAQIYRLRSQTKVDCSLKMEYQKGGSVCKPLIAPCIFNILDDPCEKYNLANRYPNILKALLNELDKFNKTAIPPSNKPMDPNADPRLYQNTWTNFGDYYELQSTNKLKNLYSSESNDDLESNSDYSESKDQSNSYSSDHSDYSDSSSDITYNSDSSQNEDSKQRSSSSSDQSSSDVSDYFNSAYNSESSQNEESKQSSSSSSDQSYSYSSHISDYSDSNSDSVYNSDSSQNEDSKQSSSSSSDQSSSDNSDYSKLSDSTQDNISNSYSEHKSISSDYSESTGNSEISENTNSIQSDNRSSLDSAVHKIQMPITHTVEIIPKVPIIHIIPKNSDSMEAENIYGKEVIDNENKFRDSEVV